MVGMTERGGSVSDGARGRRVRVFTLLAGLVLGLFAVLASPASPASAHAAVISSNPAPGAVLPTAPSEVVITFSEVVTPVQAAISVIDPQGKKIATGPAREVGDQMHIPVRTDVSQGTFLVSYRVISADGHPVGNGFTYSVGAPSPGGAPKPINGGATDPVVATGVSVMQFLGFVGLILVIGPALVLLALWPRRLDRRQPIRLAYAGLGLTAVATIGGLYLQAPYGAGSGIFDVDSTDISYVLDSHFGEAFLVRLAVLVVIGFLLRPVLAGRGGKADYWLLGVLGLVGVLTWPLAGHPGATDVAPLTVVADTAHLISVGVWIGGLVMLAVFLLRRANLRELSAILPVWSNWAMLAVSVLVLTGTAQALIEIGSVHALISTEYGLLVLAKVALLAVILLFANVGRRIVNRHTGLDELAYAGAGSDVREAVGAAAYAGGGSAPRRGGGRGPDSGGSGGDAGPDDDGDDPGDPDHDGYAGLDADDQPGDVNGDGDVNGVDDDGGEPPAPRRGLDGGILRRLRLSVLAEVVLAVAVLVATSILVQAPPAKNAAEAATEQAAAAGLITLNSSLYSMQLDVDQSNGVTELHMYVSDLNGVALAVKQWTVVATLPAQQLTVQVQVLPITQSHAEGDVTLTVPGNWTFTFTLRTTDVDEATVSTVIPIS